MSSARFESGIENKSPREIRCAIDPQERARLIRAFTRIKDQAIRAEIIQMVAETAEADLPAVAHSVS